MIWRIRESIGEVEDMMDSLEEVLAFGIPEDMDLSEEQAQIAKFGLSCVFSILDETCDAMEGIE